MGETHRWYVLWNFRFALTVGEVDGAARVQKFLRYGATGCSETGSAEVGKYVQ